MCGISGFIGPGSDSDLRRMTDALAHRGPDAAGYWGKRELYTRQNLKDWALGLCTDKPANLGAA